MVDQPAILVRRNKIYCANSLSQLAQATGDALVCSLMFATNTVTAIQCSLLFSFSVWNLNDLFYKIFTEMTPAANAIHNAFHKIVLRNIGVYAGQIL